MIWNRHEVFQPRLNYADEMRLKLFTNIRGFGRRFRSLLKVLCPQLQSSLFIARERLRLKSGCLWVLIGPGSHIKPIVIWWWWWWWCTIVDTTFILNIHHEGSTTAPHSYRIYFCLILYFQWRQVYYYYFHVVGVEWQVKWARHFQTLAVHISLEIEPLTRTRMAKIGQQRQYLLLLSLY